MNKVFLIGRLTRDPELRYTADNMATARFSLAVDRNRTNASGEREADFINIVVFGKQAENIKNYVKKGSQIAVDGRIQTGSYERDGVKRYTTDVVANNVQFLDTRSSRESGGNDNFGGFDNVSPSDFSSQMPTTDVKNDPFADFGASIEINDDELPF